MVYLYQDKGKATNQYLKTKKGETYIMGKSNKKPKLKSDKTKSLIALASVVTATASVLKVIFDFIIQLMSLSH